MEKLSKVPKREIEKVISPQAETVKEQERNLIFKGLFGLDGQKAAQTLIERIIAYPEIRRLLFIGLGGSGKTTLLLQLKSEIETQDPNVEIAPFFYDDSLARIKERLKPSKMTDAVHKSVSDELYERVEEDFPSTGNSNGTRKIQAIELVGIGSKDRGVTTLRRIAEETKEQIPMASDTLAIAVVPDYRTLKEAAKLREDIATLEKPDDLFQVLAQNNISLRGVPPEITTDAAIKRITEWYSHMARGNRINAVRDSLYNSASYLTDLYDGQLDSSIVIPDLPVPFKRVRAKMHYLKDAAYLQAELWKLGFINNPHELSFNPGRDKGLVVFSPFNPNIPKDIDIAFLFKN